MTPSTDQTQTALYPRTELVERRRSPRRHLETELGIYTDANFYSGFTGDISEGGVFVVSYVPLPVGTKVSLDLSLPGGFEIHATGTVRWVRAQRDDEGQRPGMGVRFDDLSEQDRELIREFIENREPYFYVEQ